MANIKGKMKKGNKMRTISVGFLCAGILSSTVLTSGVTEAYRIVTVCDNSGETTFSTLKTDPADMLKAQGIDIIPEDQLVVEDNGHKMQIQIVRAKKLSVQADGMLYPVTIHAGATVQDAIAQAGVVLSDQDMVNLPQQEQVQDGMSIVVQRVACSARTVTEPIAFSVVELPSDGLFEGETQIQTPGRQGELTRYIEDRIVDGQVEESIETGSQITLEPVDQVVLKGTKQRVKQSAAKGTAKSIQTPAWIQLDSNGIPANYKRVLSGRATAYSGGGTTSTGSAAQVGRVAVDPNVIPYGTQMYIVGQDGYVYGYAVASDTGGAALSGDILVDLYMSSEQECLNFGSRTVNVYLL